MVVHESRYQYPTNDLCPMAGSENAKPKTPGALVYFADTNRKPDHVAMYLGSGLVLHSPTYSQKVRIQPLWTSGLLGWKTA